jgi:hypothetical protein
MSDRAPLLSFNSMAALAGALWAWSLPAAGQTGMALGEEGIGPITARTPFQVAALRRLLPEYSVARSRSGSEGEEFPVITVSRSGETLLVINPDGTGGDIASVVVTAKGIKTRSGVTVGSGFTEALAGQTPKRCVAGEEEMSGSVICPAPKSRHITYVFRGEYDGPDGQLPPLPVLRSWRISQLVWRP